MHFFCLVSPRNIVGKISPKLTFAYFFQMGLKPNHQRDFSPEGWDKLTSLRRIKVSG